MHLKDRIYGAYQNHVVASWAGGSRLARAGDRALFWLLFTVPPACVVAVVIVYLLWRYR